MILSNDAVALLGPDEMRDKKGRVFRLCRIKNTIAVFILCMLHRHNANARASVQGPGTGHRPYHSH